MRRGRILGATAVLVAVVVGAAGPVAAADQGRVVSDQLVISTLDPSGLPESTELVTQVTTVNRPYGKLLVPTSTTDLRYLDRRGAPDTEGENASLLMGGEGQMQVILGSTFTQPLPIAMHAEYRVDGEVRAPASLSGSGQLEVTYTLLNTVMTDQRITWTDAGGAEHHRTEKVFAPFAGALQVTLPAGAALQGARGAVASTDDKGHTVLTWNVVLYPPIGSPQQTLTLRFTSDDLIVPAARLDVMPAKTGQSPAVGFSADLLDASVKGTEKLAGGLTDLNDAAIKVAQGASDLASGLDQLTGGAGQLSTAVSGGLVPGSQQLASGAQLQANGQSSLADGIGQSAAGAQSLASGTESLATGLDQISSGLTALSGPNGLPAAENATRSILAGVSALADAIGSPDDPPIDLPFDGTPTLLQLAKGSAAAAAALRTASDRLASDLEEVEPTLTDAAANATSAAAGAQSVYAAACQVDPPTLTADQCSTLQQSVLDATSAAAGAAEGAAKVEGAQLRAAAVGKGLGALLVALGGLTMGLEQVSTALRSGDTSSPGIQEALAALLDGLTAAVVALGQLSEGATASASGAQSLETGAGQLATGLDAASQGADTLAGSSQQIADGAAGLATGTEQVASGLTAFAGSMGAASEGGTQLATGASQLQSQGIEKILQQTITSSSDPAFARAYLKATSAQAADAAPYDAPEGGVARVAYVSQIAMGQADTGLGSESTRTMALLSLAVVLLVALGALAVRRIRG